MANNEVKYTEDNIRSLDWKEHIRVRPGMYIGKLGDGSSADDGIYVLVKEVMDNSIDEFVMGNGKKIDISINNDLVEIRDYGRGIPLGKVKDVVSKMNTGGKYDSRAFKKSVGLNGVGTKAVNALSVDFSVESIREGELKKVSFTRGEVVNDFPLEKTPQKNGTKVLFSPDKDIFKKYKFRDTYLEKMFWNYCYLNRGLTINYNGNKFVSNNGLKDLLEANMDGSPLYPIVHLEGNDIEVAFTHSRGYGEDYSSFVNGQHTTQGGTHQSAFREAIAKVIKDFFNKYEPVDIRQGIVAAVSVKVIEPVFESQTKTKLGSTEIEPDGQSVRGFVMDFLKEKLDNQLVKCMFLFLFFHFNDFKSDRRDDTSIFITEGDSASGSITKCRDVKTQAVFSLRGKPLNSFGLTKKVVYENEEFNLIQAALNIEEDMDNLRYNKIIIATDADVDGMHIRLLLLTFFLRFFPDLVKKNHVFILQTPLFRVRNRKETRYCYSDEEKDRALNDLGKNPEITRFKGLGEISPDEFKHFIGDDMRLEPVILTKDKSIEEILEFYMGKNTPDRQGFIIENLKVEEDYFEEEKELT